MPVIQAHAHQAQPCCGAPVVGFCEAPVVGFPQSPTLNLRRSAPATLEPNLKLGASGSEVPVVSRAAAACACARAAASANTSARVTAGRGVYRWRRATQVSCPGECWLEYRRPVHPGRRPPQARPSTRARSPGGRGAANCLVGTNVRRLRGGPDRLRRTCASHSSVGSRCEGFAGTKRVSGRLELLLKV